MQLYSKHASCRFADCRKCSTQTAVKYRISVPFKENRSIAGLSWQLSTAIVVYLTENRIVVGVRPM